jgi:hypothetical protein
MKNKKLFKIILLIAIILLAVGCGLASCKKTNAYDEIEPVVQSGSAIVCIYSRQLGKTANGFGLMGHNLANDFSVGDDIDMTTYENMYDDLFVYGFTNRAGYTDLVIYFYNEIIQGVNTFNMGYFIGNEGVLQVIGTHQFSVSITDYYILVNFTPGQQYVNYCIVQFNEPTTPQERNTMSVYGGISQIAMLSEVYTDYDYEDERPVYLYERTTTHYNEVMTLTGAPNIPIEYLIYGYNNELSPMYEWITSIKRVGFYGGYNVGYQDGLDANDTQAYQEGYNVGYQLGQTEGYNTGYQAGVSGDNAVSSFINILTSIFTGIGAIFSIELFPNITIGLFLLVPLFFGVLGLILWIWRHN